VHVSADLSLQLDSPMFWAPWHQSMSSYFQIPIAFSISIGQFHHHHLYGNRLSVQPWAPECSNGTEHFEM